MTDGEQEKTQKRGEKEEEKKEKSVKIAFQTPRLWNTYYLEYIPALQ